MLIKRNVRSWLVPLMLVVVFGGNFLGRSAHVSAQNVPPAVVDTCAGEKDTDQVQDENGVDDSTETHCANEKAQDEGACVLIGADIPDTADSNVHTQDIVDNATDGEADTQDAQDTVDNAVDTEDVQDEANSNVDTQDTDTTQDPAYVGSITVNEATFAAMSSTDRCAALTKLATLTPKQAQTVAETAAKSVATLVELDNENGFVVYSVEMADGSSVKVDAGNGDILVVEPADTTEQAD